MIDFYYWPTPNGWKVAIMLEELAVPYRTIPVNIGKGDQFKPEFLAISPNNRMPAIVDHDPPAHYGSEPVPVFESGAILWYLAEKYGRFLPADARGRKEVQEWLFWQTGNQGPMAGQLSHFVNYAPGGKDAHGYSHTGARSPTPGWIFRSQAAQIVNGMEQAMGSQKILTYGVPPGSRFALQIIAADYRLKRLALAHGGQGPAGGAARCRSW